MNPATQQFPSSARPPSNHTPLVFIIVLVVVGVIGLVTYIAMNASSSPTTSNIQTTTAAISKLSRTQALSTPGTVDTSQLVDSAVSPSIGPNADQAKVIVVEFLDFQCPYCKASATVTPQLLKKYQGQPVRFVFRNLPLESIHPYAVSAAHASLCASEQQKYFQFYDLTYQRQSEITADTLYLFARDVGVEMNAFSTCMSKGTYRTQIQKDLSDGIALGAEGTPTWFINGQRFEGALPLETLSAIIDQNLGAKK